MVLWWLNLEDVQARGWDRVRYRVSDPEQDDILHFDCETIEWNTRLITVDQLLADFPGP